MRRELFGVLVRSSSAEAARSMTYGKVASAKSIAGDTTASNNFSRKTKETCVFNKVCLFNKVFNKVCLECDAAAISHSICLTLFEIGTDGGVY